MEGNSPESEALSNSEREASPFLRVELDEEHKIFVKECCECHSQFSTSVPRKFFHNPDDESTRLRTNGDGRIYGHSEILGDDVEANIFYKLCADTARHAQET